MQMVDSKTRLDSTIVRNEAWNAIDQTNVNYVLAHVIETDRFCDFGPLGGMLSAFSHSPEASWFVLACDLPYIDQKLLEHIVQQRDPLRMATAYKSAEGQLPEPMCAIYEPKIRGRLFDSLKMNRLCPRKILIQSSIKLLEPLREQALYNANQFHEYEQVLDHLGKGMTF